MFRPLPPLLPSPECKALASWLEDTVPPTGPIVLQRNRYGLPLITVTEPERFWAYARQELADGVRGRHGEALLEFIRRVKSAVEVSI